MKVVLVRWVVRLHFIHASGPARTDLARGQALTAIVKLDFSAKPLLPSLYVLANDPDPEIKAAAKYALKQIDPVGFKGREKLAQSATQKAPAQ